MNDRELLELAAKAAGINGRWVKGFEHLGLCTSQPPLHDWWNLLSNDGDALRLLATLSEQNNRMTLYCYADEISIHASVDGALCKYFDDPAKAFRRSIVHVAAEIGKTL